MKIRTRLLLPLLLSACMDSEPLADGAGASAGSGPALIADPLALADSVVCTGDPAAATGAVVLLVHGTALAPEENFSWNYVPALQALGRTVCTVALPNNGMSDLQDGAEYVVHAIRSLFNASGRRIQIIGHSQGGMLPRWAFKYWPDTRAMVDDLVGLAASNQGTFSSIPFCESGSCPAAFWQQTVGSNFLEALNADNETWPEISYSVVYTYLDEVVTPNLPLACNSCLAEEGEHVANLATQDVCPNNAAEHLAAGTYDPAAWFAALDAIENPGPVDVLRIPIEACLQPLMPGVNPLTFAADYAALGQLVGQSVLTAEQVDAEPPLRCYAGGPC